MSHHLSLPADVRRPSEASNNTKQTTPKPDLRRLYLVLFILYYVYLFGTSILLRLVCSLPVLLLGAVGVYFLPIVRPVASMRISARFV